MADDAGAIEVEVVYALAEAQTVLRVRVAYGTTVAQAIAASGMLGQHPEIDIAAMQVGIFGERKPLTALPDDGDRIEIYRPLTADPKQARRSRARTTRGRPGNV